MAKSRDFDTTTTILNALQQERKTKATFTEEIKKAVKLHSDARVCLSQLFEDMRLGRPLALHDSIQMAGVLQENIMRNPNPLLWLTNLRLQYENTACHSVNISILAMTFGRHLRLSNGEIQALGIGGLLHDIGKTRIPPLLLEKPSRLTDAERSIVQKHVDDGFAALNATGQLSDKVLDIVRYHHERSNGQGYPEGLVGERIPQLARIVAIVDAYDSMTGAYSYRQPLASTDALHELDTIAGEEYGPGLVEEFIRCLGTYPVGSLLELHSGAIAMVVASNPEARLKPVVLVLRDEDGRVERPRMLVDLSRYSLEQLAERWGIKDKADPLAFGFNLAEIAAEEAGLH